MEEDFLSCAQREKETLPNFYRRFLQLKTQASEVSNKQVIAQAIKALRVGPLHSHLVRERPKTVLILYEQFIKFSKSQILHFRKLKQHTKYQNPMKPQYLTTMKISEATPYQYTTLILMTAGHQKIGRKFLEHLRRKDIREFSTKDPHKAAKEAEH
jgi:aspartyl-tRNA synthetase